MEFTGSRHDSGSLIPEKQLVIVLVVKPTVYRRVWKTVSLIDHY